MDNRRRCGVVVVIGGTQIGPRIVVVWLGGSDGSAVGESVDQVCFASGLAAAEAGDGSELFDGQGLEVSEQGVDVRRLWLLFGLALWLLLWLAVTVKS